MRLPWDIMVRLHRGELTPREAFVLAAQPEATAPRLVQPTIIPAFLPRTPRTSTGWRHLLDILQEHKIGVEYIDIKQYRKKWRANKKWITWGVRWKSSVYRRGGRNVLYLENGLLNQSSGAYLDTHGYFCDSSICKELQAPLPEEVAQVQRHCGSFLRSPWFSGGDPGGSWIVVMQVPRDCSVRKHHFPLREGRQPNLVLLEAAAKYLQGPVIIRPHPKDKLPFSELGFSLPDNWQVSTGGNIYEVLAASRGMVTISSTVATEALAMGLPVACLGRSAWEGHGVVLECSQDFAQLQQLPQWRPDEFLCLRYLAVVLRHQLMYHASREEVEKLPVVQTWLKKLGVVMQGMTLAQARELIKKTGKELDLVYLQGLEDRLKNCRSCAKKRIEQDIVRLAEKVGS